MQEDFSINDMEKRKKELSGASRGEGDVAAQGAESVSPNKGVDEAKPAPQEMRQAKPQSSEQMSSERMSSEQKNSMQKQPAGSAPGRESEQRKPGHIEQAESIHDEQIDAGRDKAGSGPGAGAWAAGEHKRGAAETDRPKRAGKTYGTPLPDALPAHEDEGIDYKRFITSILDRKIMVAAVVLGVFLVSLMLTLSKPAVYEARAKILRKRSKPPSGLAALSDLSQGYTMDTIKDLMKTTPIMEKVIEELKLNMSVGALSGRISVHLSNNSDVIQAIAMDSEGERAIAIVNKFSECFINRELEIKQEEALDSYKYIMGQLVIAEEQLSDAERALNAFKKEHGLVRLDTDVQQKLAQLANFDTQYRLAQVEAMAIEKKIERLKKEYSTQNEEIVLNTRYQRPLQDELIKLETELAQALTIYTDESPKVDKIKDKIAATKKLIQQNMDENAKVVTYGDNPSKRSFYQQLIASEGEKLAVESKAQALKGIKENIEKELTGLPDKELRYLELERKKNVAENVYNELVEKKGDAQLAKEIAHGNFQLVEAAQHAVKVGPKTRMNAILGLVTGLILALGAAIGVDFLRNTIKTQGDIKKALGLPSLGSISLLEGKKRLINPDPQLSMGGRFAFIRDNLSNIHLATEYKSVLVVSTERGEGKSFVASNLALTHAVEQDSAILVVADLRNAIEDPPELKPDDPTSEALGLWEYLEGEVELNDIIQETHIENLYVIMPGEVGFTNPIKLFRSDRMYELMRRLKENYGLVVVFTAEACRFSDAAVLSSMMDGILVVVEYDRLNADEIRQAVDRISSPGANFLGAIINKEKNYEWIGLQ